MRYSILSILVCLILCVSSPLRAAEGSTGVGELIAKLPADDVATGQRILAELVKLGPTGVKQMVASLSKADDAKARFALNGLAIYVGRPGAEAERAMYANALIDLLPTNPPQIQVFLINMLQLAGKDEAVAPLARFLESPELCEPATQALLCIKTPAASSALLKALPQAKDECRGTLVRALGQLRNAEAVDAILPYATSDNAALRRVALYALANIGSPKAAEVLARAAEGQGHLERAHASSLYLLYAQRLAESGHKSECVTICRRLINSRTAPQESNVLCNALSTLVQASGQEALGDVLKALDNSDRSVRWAALRLTQSMSDEAVSAALAGKMAQVDAERRAEIIHALGYRKDAKAVETVQAALKDSDKAARLAAIEAVARPGNTQAVAALLSALNAAAGDEIKAIQENLIRMPGEEAMGAVAAAAAKVPAPARVALLQVLASRRAKAQVEPVLAATGDSDKAVRVAAFKSLADLGTIQVVPRLMNLLPRVTDEAEQAELVQSVVAICLRNPDAQKRADPVRGAMTHATGNTRRLLVKALSQLGGQEALRAVVNESVSADSDRVDSAIRSLAEWRDASAAEALLKVASSAEKPNHRVLALRGCLRLLALPSRRPVAETVRMYQSALTIAQRPEEKRLALGGLSAVRDIEALKLAARYLDDETLGAEAALAAVTIVSPRSDSEQPLAGPGVVEIIRKVADTAKDAATRTKASNLLSRIAKP